VLLKKLGDYCIDSATLKLLIEQYEHSNAGVHLSYVHPIGRGIGFCAEFVGALKGAAYCYENGIRFCFQQRKRPQGWITDLGWADYFAVQLNQVDLGWLGSLNHPAPHPLLRGPFRLAAASLLRLMSGAEYFPVSGLPRPTGKFRFGQQNVEHSDQYWSSMQNLARVLFAFNQDTRARVDSQRSLIANFCPTIAVHMRRGDKQTEAAYVPISHYAAFVNSLISSPEDSVVIASDDRRAAESLARLIDPRIAVVIAAKGTGHQQSEFNQQTLATRTAETICLFAELEILASADHFIGTETSNIFHFVKYLRGNISCHEAKNAKV